MSEFFGNIPLIWAVVICSCFTWGVTTLGSATVFFFKKINIKILNALMGFAAGVMIAASFWSLLSPSISLSEDLGYLPWLFPAVGFLTGGAFVVVTALMLDKYAVFSKNGLHDEKLIKSKKRSFLLVTSITLHNIPEGMSVGVAFGALAAGTPGADIVGAVVLALGIGLQNFPEGAAVSLPLRRDGMGMGKSFFYGQASGFVEPVAAIIGYYLALTVNAALPFLLAFSAGAMIAVAASELLPESAGENKSIATMGCVLGFMLMMILDVALS